MPARSSGRWTYRSEWVRCGKKCGGCPHGPYWYRYRRVKGKLHKEYVGHGDPGTGWPGEPAQKVAAPHRWDAILNDKTATLTLCCEILGITYTTNRETARSQFRHKMREAHPDRGGDPRQAIYLNAAWTFWCSINGS